MAGAEEAMVMTGRSRALALTGRDINAIKLAWMVRLRWGAVVGQFATLVVASGVLGLRLPLPAMFALLGLEVAVNLVLQRALRRKPEVRQDTVAGAMLFDAAVITGLLALSGGPHNPFTTMYLVGVALAALILTSRWAWTMLAVNVGLYGLLFVMQGVPVPALGPVDQAALDRFHLLGTAVAFAVSGGFIVYIAQRLQRELRQAEVALAAERSLSSRRDKVASLATLAAGAAHELSTPLSTIAVVAKELERHGDPGRRPAGGAAGPGAGAFTGEALPRHPAPDVGPGGRERGRAAGELLARRLGGRGPGVPPRERAREGWRRRSTSPPSPCAGRGAGSPACCAAS